MTTKLHLSGIIYQSFGGCMKYRIIITALIMSIGALICSSFSFAQPQDHQMPLRGGPMPREEFLKDLKKKLNLTSEQEQKIQNIFNAQSEEIDKERNAMREKMEKQRKETDAQISAVLTDEQKKKYKELKREHAQRPPRMRKSEGEI
jgi:periplasmic protein CpxP/Spy